MLSFKKSKANAYLQNVSAQVLFRLCWVYVSFDDEGHFLPRGLDPTPGLHLVGFVTARIAQGCHYHYFFEMWDL